MLWERQYSLYFEFAYDTLYGTASINKDCFYVFIFELVSTVLCSIWSHYFIMRQALLPLSGSNRVFRAGIL